MLVFLNELKEMSETQILPINGWLSTHILGDLKQALFYI